MVFEDYYFCLFFLSYIYTYICVCMMNIYMYSYIYINRDLIVNQRVDSMLKCCWDMR